MVDHGDVGAHVIAHVRTARDFLEQGFLLKAAVELRAATAHAPDHPTVTAAWAALLAACPPAYRTEITAQRDRARASARQTVVSFDAACLWRIQRCTVVADHRGTCIVGIGPSDVHRPIVAAVLARAGWAVAVSGRVAVIHCAARLIEDNPPNFRLRLTPNNRRDRAVLKALRMDPTRTLSAIAAVVIRPQHGEGQRVRNIYHWPDLALANTPSSR